MLGKIAGAAFKAILESLIGMWNRMSDKAEDVEKGADKVKLAQQADEIERAKKATDVKDEVREMSDDDLDAGMGAPK